MAIDQIRGEVDHCRYRLLKYCRGQGLDLGCGGSKIRVDAIGIDLYNPMADMNCDAQLLEQYPNEFFDYVFSSHLLEEIEDTESTLREWLRVIKRNGNLVLYQADKNIYYPLGHPQCNFRHKHHFSWEDLWGILKRIDGVKLIHHNQKMDDEWSFELVVKKTENEMEQSMTGEGISILIPTLNRPQGMEMFTIALDRTTLFPENVEIIFGVQEEDQASIQKAVELKGRCRVSIRYEIIQRYPDGKINLSFLWNQIYAKALYPILGYFGDDCVFRTPGWDEEVRREFIADKTILVCCNDVYVQCGKLATLFFTHRCVHEKFGLYLNERFRRWCGDTYWDRIYREAGKLHYREDIVCEHLHPDKFPERADATYKNMEIFKNEDLQLFSSPAMQEEIHNRAQELKVFKTE
jgi:predicted SAM-dependent methyltransferase